jgi:hypothetical protein
MKEVVMTKFKVLSHQQKGSTLSTVTTLATFDHRNNHSGNALSTDKEL